MEQHRLPAAHSGLKEEEDGKTEAEVRAKRRQTIGPISSSASGKAKPATKAPTPAPSKREREFKGSFAHLGENFIDHYYCSLQSLQSTVQHQGRVYLTANYICFISTAATGDYTFTLPFAEVTSIQKKNTVFLFPNAIWVVHTTNTEVFTGFFVRDKAFDLMHSLWTAASNATASRKTLIKQEPKASKPMPANSSSNLLVAGASNLLSMSDGMPKAKAKEVPSVTVEPLDLAESKEDKKKRRRSMSALSAGLDGNYSAVSVPASGPRSARSPREVAVRFTEDQPAGAAARSLSPPALRQGLSPSVEGTKSAGEAGEGKAEDGEGEEGEGAEEEPAEPVVPMPPQGPCSHAVHSESGIRGIQVVDERFPVSMSHLYDHYVRDGAIYQEVMEGMGSWEMTVPEWAAADNAACHLARLVTFTSPIKGAPIGPKQTRVEQTHVVSMRGEDTIEVSTSTRSLDVPYADAFLVEAVWLLTAEGSNSSRMQIHVYVNFKKSVWVKSIIDKKAKDDTQAFFVRYADEIKAAIAREPKEGAKEKAGKKKSDSKKKGEKRKKKRKVRRVEAAPQSPESSWTTLTIPMLDVQVPLYDMLIVGAICLLFGVLFLAWLDTRAAAAEATRWEEEVKRLESRTAFLQLFAGRLAHNVSGGVEDALEQEWQHWRRSEGGDWTVAEWKSQLLQLQELVATASGTLANVAGQTNLLGGDAPVLGEAELARFTHAATGTEVPLLEELPVESLLYFLMRTATVLTAVAVTLLAIVLACTVNLWEPMLKGFLSL